MQFVKSIPFVAFVYLSLAALHQVAAAPSELVERRSNGHPCLTFEDKSENTKLFKSPPSAPFKHAADGTYVDLDEFGNTMWNISFNPFSIENRQPSGEKRLAVAIDYKHNDGQDSTAYFTIRKWDQCFSSNDPVFEEFANPKQITAIYYYQLSKWPKSLW